MAVQFRKEAMKKFSAPEELKDNVMVTNPRIVLGLIGASIILIAVIAWTLFGNLIISTHLTGIAKDGTLTCFSQSNNDIEPGMKVLTEGQSGTITSVSPTLVSRDSIANGFEDYEMYELKLDEFSYVIKVDIDGLDNGIVSATIIQDIIHPVSLVFSKEA